jgi:hypothetical protein
MAIPSPRGDDVKLLAHTFYFGWLLLTILYIMLNIHMSLCITMPLFVLCHSLVLLFISSMLYVCVHAVTSAAFAAVQLGEDDNQLLLAWIAMRIPFPIGAPVHSLLYTHPRYYLIIPS